MGWTQAQAWTAYGATRNSYRNLVRKSLGYWFQCRARVSAVMDLPAHTRLRICKISEVLFDAWNDCSKALVT